MPKHIRTSLIIALLALGCSESRDVTDIEAVEPVQSPGDGAPSDGALGVVAPGGPLSCDAPPAGPLAALRLTPIV
jgi:hypothetical protein